MRQAKAAKYLGLMAGLAVLLAAAPGEARIKHRSHQEVRNDYSQRGFQLYLGFGGQGYEITDKDYDFLDELGSDGMFFIGAALGVDQNVALYLEANGSEHETPVGNRTFGYAHVGVKYAPNSHRANPWQPYGKASFGAIYLTNDNHRDDCHCHHDYSYEEEETYFGPSLGLAAGLDRFISERVALFGEVGGVFGRFERVVIDDEDYELDDDVGLNSGRIQFGIRFRF